jgi:hypothetical protein
VTEAAKILDDGDRIVFSTGRSVSPNRGIVGLSPELEVFEGYDGQLEADGAWEHDMRPRSDLTPVERSELAELMIERWQRYRDAARAA